ncbi:MAG: alpha/beta hydrolase family protein [Actinomycetota bacterium]
MNISERALAVVCDGLRLPGGAYVPADPKAAIALLHGIPSIAPPDPNDDGYPGLARRFAERGWAASWADMRGARGAPGFFSIEGWVRDARAIIDATRSIEGAAGLPLAVLGSSAGGAVAVEAAARGAPLDALVLLAAPSAWVTFAGDAGAGMRRITEEAGMPLAAEVLDDATEWAAEFDSVVAERAISKVKAPVLIVHGTADDVVPIGHAHRLAEAARTADLRLVEGAPHQLRRHPGVLELVADWLEKAIA